MISRYNNIVTIITKISTLNFFTTLSDVTIFDNSSQSFLCSSDIINYNFSIDNNVCRNLMYQSTDSVVTVAVRLQALFGA